MANYHVPSEAVDCHIHSVRYDMVLEYCSWPSPICPYQVTFEAVDALRDHKEHDQWQICY
eukprot:scaffold3306_cov109-Skeletonema_dohrnii-CCMP3373.AAC.7